MKADSLIFEVEKTERTIEDLPFGQIVAAPFSRIVRWRDQPRTNFDAAELESLSDDIKARRERGLGLFGSGFDEPIKCRWQLGSIESFDNGVTRVKTGSNLIITDGERKHRAAEIAGFSKTDLVPVLILDQTEAEAYDFALRTFIFKEGLSEMDQARAILAIKNRDKLSFRQLAEHLQRPVAWVQKRLDLLRFTEEFPEIAAMVNEKKESMSAAQLIGRVKDEEVREWGIQQFQQGASFEELRTGLVRRQKEKARTDSRTGRKSPTGLKVVPRVNVEDTLNAMIRQADSALDALTVLDDTGQTLPAITRMQIRVKLDELKGLIERLESYTVSKRGKERNGAGH